MGWVVPRKFQSLYDYMICCIKRILIQIRDFRDVSESISIWLIMLVKIFRIIWAVQLGNSNSLKLEILNMFQTRMVFNVD